MIYGSVCSGIEAATVAWNELGWRPSFFSEIEKFPRKVLMHHYPDVPLHGDFTTIKGHEYEPINLLVGGTPCQSFSVAGLRKGLDDPRGNLMLEFGALARRTRAEWLVWENVPGVLSANGGRDFGTFLGMLAELGYGFAYRVLDAQYFGVPQRRRRVFVVGRLGDWRSAAAVLFERYSLSGNPAPRREKRKEVTEIAGTFAANGGGLNRPAGNANELDFCVATTAKCLTRGVGQRYDFETEDFITYGIAGNIIGRKPENGGNGEGISPKVGYTLTKTDQHGVAHPLAFNQQGSISQGLSISNDIVPTLDKSKVHGIMQSMAVRRLTPTECERLQGFPDGYTKISNKTPDGPRYKALGNSMAVPVMRWIGRRIDEVNNLNKGEMK